MHVKGLADLCRQDTHNVGISAPSLDLWLYVVVVRSWFELKFAYHLACELARASRFAAKFHYAMSRFEAGSKLVRSWFDPDSVMEFGFEPASN